MLKIALPYEIYNPIFGTAAFSAQEELKKFQYRDAQYIQPRWPKDQIGLHAHAPAYAASVPPNRRTEGEKQIFTICPILNTQVSATKLEGDDYLFSIHVNSGSDKDPIDWVVFTPVHPAFIVEPSKLTQSRTITWFGMKFANGADFRYIGKYPIDEVNIEVYRSKDRPKCQQSVYLARDLRP